MAGFSKITGGLSKVISANNSFLFASSIAETDSDALSIAEYALSMARISATGSTELDGSDTVDYYGIAPSISDRTGLVVYMTESFATVDLAKADSGEKMPGIGIISHDADNVVSVRTLSGLVSTTYVDSDADVETGDKIFMSNLETGKVTNVPPETGVLQVIGISRSDPVDSKIELLWDPKFTVYL